MPFPSKGTASRRSNPESDPARRPIRPGRAPRLFAGAAGRARARHRPRASGPRRARALAPRGLEQLVQHLGVGGDAHRAPACRIPSRDGPARAPDGRRDSMSANAAQSPPAPGWPCTSTTTGPFPASIGARASRPRGSAPVVLTAKDVPGAGRARAGAKAPGGPLCPPPGDQEQGLGHGVGRHLGGPELPVHEPDRHLGHLGTHTDRPVGHLDLESVAPRPHRAQVDSSQHRRRIGPVAGRRVPHAQAEHEIGVDVAAPRQQPARQAPIRYRTAGDIARPDAHLVSLAEGRHDRGQGVRIVGEVRIHLDHRLVAALEAPPEPVPIGAAEAHLGGPGQDVHTGEPLCVVRHDLGRTVRAVVVDDEDRRLRQCLADPIEDVLDCGSFIESRQHNENAHPCSLWPKRQPAVTVPRTSPPLEPQGSADRTRGATRCDRHGDAPVGGGPPLRAGRTVLGPQLPRDDLDGARGGNSEQGPDKTAERRARRSRPARRRRGSPATPRAGSGGPSGSSRPDSGCGSRPAGRRGTRRESRSLPARSAGGRRRPSARRQAGRLRAAGSRRCPTQIASTPA